MVDLYVSLVLRYQNRVMVAKHHPAGCEHPLVKVREHVWLQIREHLVVMPCDVYPDKAPVLTLSLPNTDRTKSVL